MTTPLPDGCLELAASWRRQAAAALDRARRKEAAGEDASADHAAAAECTSEADRLERASAPTAAR